MEKQKEETDSEKLAKVREWYERNYPNFNRMETKEELKNILGL
jgi:hypothetical protein